MISASIVKLSIINHVFPNKDAVSLFIGEYKKVAEIIEKNTAFSINMNMCCKNRCVIDHFRTKLNVLEKKTNSIRNAY